MDWDRNGEMDLIVADRNGFIFLLENSKGNSEPFFEYKEPLKDSKTGRVINIPYENPNHMLDELGGYIDPEFFNYIYPVLYPGDNGEMNLVIGDWAGNLWWLPDISKGVGKAMYSGIEYSKTDSSLKSPGAFYSKFSKKHFENYGTNYVKPEHKICDESGKPILLGTGVDGMVTYHGCNTRPVVYKNPETGLNDLIVICGAMESNIYYLKRLEVVGSAPAFECIGEVKIDNFPKHMYNIQFHSKFAVLENDKSRDLLLSCGNNIAFLKNKNLVSQVPEFEFKGYISGKDTIASGYRYTETLMDTVSGKHYILDSTWQKKFVLREIKTIDGHVKLMPEVYYLEDEQGVFETEGETDPQFKSEGGITCAIKWDFDNSNRQHLIIGTDKGLLYLLIDDGNVGIDGKFKYKSVGPLKDCKGNVIKIHNRVFPGPVDLNNDGFDDLILGGASYQDGIKSDPNPGGGVYYLLHLGLDEKGLPILDTVKKLDICGFEYKFSVNDHVWVRTVDVDKDGQKEVVISVRNDGYTARVFSLKKDSIGIEYTGKIVSGMHSDEHLIDIDNDGNLELVVAGGEPGIAYYWKLDI
jgi:hypothetical protein